MGPCRSGAFVFFACLCFVIRTFHDDCCIAPAHILRQRPLRGKSDSREAATAGKRERASRSAKPCRAFRTGYMCMGRGRHHIILKTHRVLERSVPISSLHTNEREIERVRPGLAWGQKQKRETAHRGATDWGKRDGRWRDERYGGFTGAAWEKARRTAPHLNPFQKRRRRCGQRGQERRCPPTTP